MQTTETFAATVAAVAPGIVLVGVVEMDHHRKIHHDSLAAEVDELHVAIDSLPAQPMIRARYTAEGSSNRYEQPLSAVEQASAASGAARQWLRLRVQLIP
ncbi:hypothetical protein [Streptomyces sp. KN37]|uniref:hypothetical protein n=1 Tax=Streptomyces sp. KN37 TaxID=3090667 RepID=UPI002A761BBD|nr:hypothetical protein [Streptomyces sp. KN37]WPO75139.1 hypothetical protein R9806_33305 [Streptomyces sp. KN37]